MADAVDDYWDLSPEYRATAEMRLWDNVDKSGDCWMWTGGVASHGYGTIWIGSTVGRKYLVHRLSWVIANNGIPSGMLLDHTCHVRRCVNPEHLRVVTYKQNMENIGNLRSDNTSGVRGVSWSARRNRWMTCVQHDGRTYGAGSFLTKEEADQACRDLRNRLYTHNDLDRLAVVN